MEVWHEGVRLVAGKPLRARRALALRTVPIATGVVGDARRTPVAALLDVATEHGHPTRRDGAHHASLHAAEVTGMRLSKTFAVAAEYVRHLQSRTHDARSAGRNDLQSQPVKRTRGLMVLVATWVQRAVLCKQVWPSSTWMTPMSAPFSRRCVAKLWRSVCTVTSLFGPAAIWGRAARRVQHGRKRLLTVAAGT